MFEQTTTETPFNYKTEIRNRQRTANGLRFEREMRAFAEMATSNDEAIIAARAEANQGLCRLRDADHRRDIGPDAVHVDQAIQNMSVRYANDEYIGDRLMPATTVDKKSNLFFIYDERAQLAFPDDSLGSRGQANEVGQNVSRGQYICTDRGFEEYVDLNEIGNADAPLDPLADATMLVNEGLAFRREVRIANVLTTAGNFGGNTTAIGAGQEWNSSTGGNPVKLIQAAVDQVFPGPSATRLVGYCSVNVFRTLSRHPAIRDIFKYTREGFATASQLAGYFGLDDLLVGKARQDTTPLAASATVGRIWADVFGVVRVAAAPSVRCYQFGTTFRFGPILAQQIYKQELGRAGGYIAKVTLSEDHRVVASRAGFLITNCYDPALG